MLCTQLQVTFTRYIVKIKIKIHHFGLTLMQFSVATQLIHSLTSYSPDYSMHGKLNSPRSKYCLTVPFNVGIMMSLNISVFTLTDKRPTVRELQLLLFSGRRIEIIKTLAPRWQHFGTHLGFDSVGRNIDLIRERHPGDPESACKEMFQMWLKGCGVGPATWRTLAQLLEDFEHKILAADVRKHFKF